MNKARKLAQIGRDCVACGCCVPSCPMGAVTIEAGVTARVNQEKCMGCGRCVMACPAAVITLLKREAAE